MKKLIRFTMVLGLVLAFSPFVLGQSAGDRAKLESTNPNGVPVHTTASDASYVRWENGSLVTVVAVDTNGKWFHISSNGKEGWVTKNYVTALADSDQDTEPAENEAANYVVGTWNLEWFDDAKSRGFPEDAQKGQRGPQYGPRTLDDFKTIAGIITNQLTAKILVLEEINGRPGQVSSVEMDRLVGCLGTNWGYVITKSGGAQRVAILYDSTAARKDFSLEMDITNTNVQGAGVFEREPLVAKFTFLNGKGEPKNDLVVVGVHLASGQELNENHNRAMELLRTALRQEFTNEPVLRGEQDVLIMGDFNADRYDNHPEDYWVNYDPDGFNFKTMSPDEAADYPPTRMAGVPLFPRSRIDYILASGNDRGIQKELVQLTGQVHTELLPAHFDDFRAHVSDHIPVTVRVQLVADDD